MKRKHKTNKSDVSELPEENPNDEAKSTNSRTGEIPEDQVEDSSLDAEPARKKKIKEKPEDEEMSWFQTEKEWEEHARNEKPFHWKELQWQTTVQKMNHSLLKILLNSHNSGARCKLDDLLETECPENADPKPAKVTSIEYPNISLNEPLESYIQPLPPLEVPAEWVLGGPSRGREVLGEDEVEEPVDD